MKIREFFKKLDLKNNPNTVLAIILEIILVGDIVSAAINGASLFDYVCVIIIAMMYVFWGDYNYRRFRDRDDEK